MPVTGIERHGIRFAVDPVTDSGEKSPEAAFALSLFYAGLGHLYCGQTKKAILVFFGSLFGMLLITPGLIIFLYGAYDAYRTAGSMAKGEIGSRSPCMREIGAFFAVTLLGLALFGAGAALLLLSLLLRS
jgi:hypothetical protein